MPPGGTTAPATLKPVSREEAAKGSAFSPRRKGRTDEDGAFSVEAVTFGGDVHVCVKVRAIPSEASTLRADSVIISSVHFAPGASGDTVRVDVLVRP